MDASTVHSTICSKVLTGMKYNLSDHNKYKLTKHQYRLSLMDKSHSLSNGGIKLIPCGNDNYISDGIYLMHAYRTAL